MLPGDAFLTRCRYEASQRTAMTHYGPSADEEMCIALVFITPAPAGGSFVCMDWEGAYCCVLVPACAHIRTHACIL